MRVQVQVRRKDIKQTIVAVENLTQFEEQRYSTMKRHWTHDDLAEQCTILPDEYEMLATTRSDHTRLGLAVLLKNRLKKVAFESIAAASAGSS